MTFMTPGHDSYRHLLGRVFSLEPDNWDDFGFKTMFKLLYTESGAPIEIGYVKIASQGMTAPSRTEGVYSVYLDGEYFSLGQDEEYYRKLTSLGPELSSELLRAMNDLAYDPDLFHEIMNENVVQTSLLRWVQPSTVEEQFRRIAMGGEVLTGYRFKYESPPMHSDDGNTIQLSFEVKPNSNPPTNIHAIIGSNGVGKTRILTQLAEAATDRSGKSMPFGRLIDDMGHTMNPFVNLISVSFSAFDPFSPVPSSNRIKHTQVNINNPRQDTGSRISKPFEVLAEEFRDSIRSLVDHRLERWISAIRTLEADPLFEEADITSLVDSLRDLRQKERPRQLFEGLSAGHKIVLLTITQLANLMTERTLVLLDEPETHLHPPLLSTFVRAVSDLLVTRNGIAIIATHSPVVLQEIPRTCVWKLRRSGNIRSAERPEIETFGENVGVLTYEAFGLEVTRSGFHQLLEQATHEFGSYQSIFEKFGGQLGGEARAITQALLAIRRREEEL